MSRNHKTKDFCPGLSENFVDRNMPGLLSPLEPAIPPGRVSKRAVIPSGFPPIGCRRDSTLLPAIGAWLEMMMQD